MRHGRYAEQHAGKWRGLLVALGVPRRSLDNRHHPCPLCGGKDRFRFDDKDGLGSWICSRCGAGDGMSLAMRVSGRDFKATKKEIERMAGSVNRVEPRPRPSNDWCISEMVSLWQRSKPFGGAAADYLAKRGLGKFKEFADLRVRYNGPHGNEMLAVARGLDGKGCQLHRTILPTEWKPGTPIVRKFMPGTCPPGLAVRLMPAGETLGVAEGIETALSASTLFGVPVWATLNAGLLEKWRPPAGVKLVFIFGDHDASFTGQAAAYALARALYGSVAVTIRLPEMVGEDWNDVLMRRKDTA